MSIVLIAIYFITYCVSFAGYGILTIIKSYDRREVLSSFFPFLVAFFFYIFQRNSSFFIVNFLNDPGFVAGRWHPFFDTVCTFFLLFSYTRFFPHLIPELRPGFLTKSIKLLAWLPLFSVPIWALTQIFGSPFPSFYLLISRVNVILVCAVLCYSSLILLKFEKSSPPSPESFLIRFFGFGNLALLPFLIFQIFYNYILLGPFGPISIENLYCASIHIVNIALLAKKLILDETRKTELPSQKMEFSSAENEIIMLIRKGLPNKAIAPQLGISEYVVKNHIHQILKKSSTKNRVELLCKLDDLAKIGL